MAASSAALVFASISWWAAQDDGLPSAASRAKTVKNRIVADLGAMWVMGLSFQRLIKYGLHDH
jgi:hypothetical protein